MVNAPRPALFFDRDGVINASPGPGYVLRVEDFHILPAFIEALRIAARRGWPAVVVTNQRGVGLGLMTQAELDRIHTVLTETLAREGFSLLAMYAATAVDRSDPMRKPQPGMLHAAAQAHQLDLRASWMIGDSERDVEAGLAAGCHTVLIGDASEPSRAEIRLPDMDALPRFLEQTLPDLSQESGVRG
jgi:D-glycero-D-manno-heptose 1,7-bisphosphate phosphatase